MNKGVDGMDIRPYSSEYLEAFCDLYISIWRAEPYGELFTTAEVKRHMWKNERFLFLLVDDGTLVGFVGGRPVAHFCDFFDNRCVPSVSLTSGFYIDELGVAPAFRGRGRGSALMRWVMGSAANTGFTEFVLRTHADKQRNPAMPMYSRLGFEERLDDQGTVHSVPVKQARIDSRPDVDIRTYLYKVVG